MIQDIKSDVELRMQKTLESLHHEMAKVRTGRANASFLDHVEVDYYGHMTPINQVANVAAGDARTLLVTPFEKNMTAAIEKAILTSDLGLNPANSGNVIRVPMPALNEERRKEMIKIVRGLAEQSRVALRNIRRDGNQELKDLVKDKAISEDDERRGNDLIQKLTDSASAAVENILADKEKELLEV
jgi:ribosome recycling factor